MRSFSDSCMAGCAMRTAAEASTRRRSASACSRCSVSRALCKRCVSRIILNLASSNSAWAYLRDISRSSKCAANTSRARCATRCSASSTYCSSLRTVAQPVYCDSSCTRHLSNNICPCSATFLYGFRKTRVHNHVSHLRGCVILRWTRPRRLSLGKIWRLPFVRTLRGWNSRALRLGSPRD